MDVKCPACGSRSLDVKCYRSLMVLSPKRALFTLRCPSCGTVVSTLQPIPAELREEIRFAAIEVGAGMGQG